MCQDNHHYHRELVHFLLTPVQKQPNYCKSLILVVPLLYAAKDKEVFLIRECVCECMLMNG